MTENREPTRVATARRSSAGPLARRPAMALALALTSLAAVGCSKSEAPATELKDNVANTVGEPQQSQGMFGGNSAPADAGADTADAGCTVASRGCAATPAADAGG